MIHLLIFIAHWRHLIYGIIFVGMFFEGDAMLFTIAFLTRQGAFDVGDVAVAVLSGMFIGDVGWYFLGRFLNASPSRLNRWLIAVSKHFDSHLLKRPLRTIFISKFTYGLHHIMLMRAGALGVKLSEFVRNDIISTIPWFLVVGGLGYLSGASFTHVRHYLHFVEFFLIPVVIIFLLIERFIVARRLKKVL